MEEQMINTMSGFFRGQAARAAKSRTKTFDWDKAAQLIKEKKPTTARAGLSEDWEYTGGRIFEKGKIIPEKETYVYLSSNWATPELELDGEIMNCWKYQNETEWDEKTYWPESARKVLNETS